METEPLFFGEKSCPVAARVAVITGLKGNLSWHGRRHCSVQYMFISLWQPQAFFFMFNGFYVLFVHTGRQYSAWTCINQLVCSLSLHRSDYEDMPLQNGRAIKTTTKYQDETDSDWWDVCHSWNLYSKLCVNKKNCVGSTKGDTLSVHKDIFLIHVNWMYCTITESWAMSLLKGFVYC